MTYYYPIEINREEISASGEAGIGRNRRYVYDITLTRVGTISPEMLAGWLCDEYDIDMATAISDVNDLLDVWRRHGLIKEEM